MLLAFLHRCQCEKCTVKSNFSFNFTIWFLRCMSRSIEFIHESYVIGLIASVRPGALSPL